MGAAAGPDIIEDGLVLCLDAANPKSYPGSGNTWYDISGKGNNATIFGTNYFTTNFNGMFDFGENAQTSSGIRLPHEAARLTGNSYTLEFWMRPSSNGTRYFSSLSDGSNHNHLLIQKSTSEIFMWNESSNSISFSDNEFLQFVIVRDNSNTGNLIKNGGQQNVTSTGIDIINTVATNGWQLNQEQDSVNGGFVAGENYYGAFISVKLYSRALTLLELKQNYNALKKRFNL